MNAPEDVTKTIAATLELLNGAAWPCERASSCIEAETRLDSERAAKRRDGRRDGYHGYDPNRMCPACAATWHVACAYNFALGVSR